MNVADQDLERLVAAVRSTRKYRTVTPDLVRGLGARELDKGREWKEALQATRRKLHQVAGAFWETGARYERWLEELRAAGPAGLRPACAQVMAHHASTRERLPLLDQFYARLFAGRPPARRVLDVGCGLHPLALPWMPLAPDAEYLALDIFQDLAGFLNAFFALLPARGRAEARDVLGPLPEGRFDVAFLLKTIPCLEQLDREAGRRLLETVPADVLLVSFPLHTLGGRRDRGMHVNYEAHFQELIAGRPWQVERFEFANELVLRVEKTGLD